VEEEQQKINHYAKYGFQTLVIWEHELKDINNVMNRILEFNNV
jgi:G:T-mismatch repair DNA endonuclease (very short patch repair protein)